MKIIDPIDIFLLISITPIIIGILSYFIYSYNNANEKYRLDYLFKNFKIQKIYVFKIWLVIQSLFLMSDASLISKILFPIIFILLILLSSYLNKIGNVKLDKTDSNYLKYKRSLKIRKILK
jgi:hypothetical protein